MSPVTRRTTKLAVAAVLAGVSLTGCAALKPGVAAEIGDDSITTSELDDFASTFCTYNAKIGQPISSAEARSNGLTILIRSDLSEGLEDAFGDEVDEAAVDQGVKGVAEVLDDVDDEEREAFLDEVRRAIAANQMVQQAAVAGLQRAGEQPTQETVTAASEQIYAGLAEEAGVEIDPRFGTFKDVVVTPGSGSLSVPSADTEVDTSLPGAKPCG